MPRARHVGAQGAQREHLLDAARARMRAGLGVELRALLAHLAHVAQHQQARAGQAGQHVDGRTHGVGVGVVAVVHHGDATHAEGARAALDRHEGRKALRDRIERHTRRDGAGSGSQRVRHVVAARDRQVRIEDALRRGDAHGPAAVPPPRGCAAHLARIAERDAAARARQFAPERRERIGGGEHGHAVGGQRGEHAAVLARHGFHGVHEFEMLALRVVDQRHRRPGDVREVGDLAGMVHAHLHHGRLVRGPQAQQRERHADVVVEVALRGKGGRTLPGAQHGCDHLRDGGLAVAARHADERQAPLRAPARSQRAERAQRVGHLDAGQARGLQPRMRHGGHCARLARLGQKLVRVETLALERHEQVARRQRARVAVHAHDERGTVAHEARAGHEGMHLRQGHHRPAVHAASLRSESASRACAMSENGWRRPAVSW